jgi:DNA-binding response OmpR family regulator
MSKRILSVSYDVSLLATRRMMLEVKGYSVTSALGFTQSLEHCKAAGFDLFILGHSIPLDDKQALIRNFKENCPAPILSLERMGEPRVDSDYHASPDNPEQLLRLVESIIDGAEHTGGKTSQADPQSWRN